MHHRQDLGGDLVANLVFVEAGVERERGIETKESAELAGTHCCPTIRRCHDEKYKILQLERLRMKKDAFGELFRR